MQYDRVISVQIRLINAPDYTSYRGTLDIKGLRISFNISKSISWATNTANINIWNLSANNRNQIENYGDELKLFAGYASSGGPQLLFVGDTTQVSHNFSFPEIISVLNAGDGEKILNNQKITVSFGANTTANTILQYVADQMQMPLIYDLPPDNFSYEYGMYSTNLSKNILDQVCKDAGYVFSVQNGNLLILRKNEAAKKPPALINIDTGMIGVPERYTDKRGELWPVGPKVGWRVRTLLRPDIIPGDSVRIRSNQVPLDGLFYVLTIKHQGDNYGPNFESLLEVIAL
jgi:hypothetical protein